MDDAPAVVVLASGNRHKVGELAAMLDAALGAARVRVLGLADVEAREPAPIVDEDAPDFRGNACRKADGIAAWLARIAWPGDTLVLADDSGVCVDALDGAPGVHSARFAGPDADDAANNARLVAELGSRGLRDSPAHYVCVLALRRVDGRAVAPSSAATLCFDGRWDVVASVMARGSGGFGYDPHCWLLDGDRTVAELSAADKASRSHRGQALAALLDWWRARGPRPVEPRGRA